MLSSLLWLNVFLISMSLYAMCGTMHYLYPLIHRFYDARVLPLLRPLFSLLARLFAPLKKYIKEKLEQAVKEEHEKKIRTESERVMITCKACGAKAAKGYFCTRCGTKQD